MKITEPCVVWDLDEAVYHSDVVEGGSLSVSSAKHLLPPSCPAKFRWMQDNPEPRDNLEFGTAVHTLTLGTGAELVVIDAPDWRSKAAKEARDEARMTGLVPLLAKDHDRAKAIAAAVHGDEYAAPYLAGEGDVEASLFWRDEPTGVMRRGRLDYLRRGPGRPIVVDLKTSVSANPDEFARSAAKYGYDIQGHGYREGVEAHGLADDPAVVFIVVEKEPPFLVSVVEIDTRTLQTGAALNRRAVDTYAACVESGTWAGYLPAVVSVPEWRHYQALEIT